MHQIWQSPERYWKKGAGGYIYIYIYSHGMSHSTVLYFAFNESIPIYCRNYALSGTEKTCYIKHMAVCEHMLY